MTQPVREPAAPDLIRQLRAELQAAQKALRERYEADANARAMLYGRTRLVDKVLLQLWQAAALPAGYALVAASCIRPRTWTC